MPKSGIRKHEACPRPGPASGGPPVFEEPGKAQATALWTVPQVWPTLLLWTNFAFPQAEQRAPAGRPSPSAVPTVEPGPIRILPSLTLQVSW